MEVVIFLDSSGKYLSRARENDNGERAGNDPRSNSNHRLNASSVPGTVL